MANPAPVIVQRPHPDGPAGLRLSAEEIEQRISRDFRDPEVMKWARRTISDANIPGVRGRPEPTPIVWALFAAIKKRVAFLKDPVGTELMYASRHLLCLDEYCVGAGDCDDQLIVLGAACMSVGIPVRLRVRRYKGQSQGHVTMLYDSNRKLGGPWLCIDPSMEDGVCSPAAFVDEFTMDVINPEGGLMFIGVGDPPDGDLGDNAPSELLPPDEADAWSAQMQLAHDSLARSAAGLRAMRSAYVQIRSELGLAAVDAPAPPSGTSALNAYSSSMIWTARAASDEAKLLQVADFVQQCLADGLAGRRQVGFDPAAKDVVVATAAGDPYRVLMVVPSGGGPAIPTILDAQGTEGSLGILQFIVGAAVIAAVSLAVAYGVGKLCDYLAQTHHDDALAKVSDNQTSLVAQGKETPEQAAAQVRAMTDLAQASTLPKESIFSGVGGVALGAVAGAVVGVAADRLIGFLMRPRAA